MPDIQEVKSAGFGWQTGVFHEILAIPGVSELEPVDGAIRKNGSDVEVYHQSEAAWLPLAGGGDGSASIDYDTNF